MASMEYPTPCMPLRHKKEESLRALPIFRESENLVKTLLPKMGGMDKRYRHVLGEMISSKATEIVSEVRYAAYTPNEGKIPHLDRILFLVEDITAWLDICASMYLIGKKGRVGIYMALSSIQQQAFAWKRGTESRVKENKKRNDNGLNSKEEDLVYGV